MRNDHQAQFPASPSSRINCVKRFAELVEVIAATIEMPMSHHGIERPEWKKSDAPCAPRRLAQTGIASRMAKNAAMTR